MVIPYLFKLENSAIIGCDIWCDFVYTSLSVIQEVQFSFLWKKKNIYIFYVYNITSNTTTEGCYNYYIKYFSNLWRTYGLQRTHWKLNFNGSKMKLIRRPMIKNTTSSYIYNNGPLFLSYTVVSYCH